MTGNACAVESDISHLVVLGNSANVPWHFRSWEWY